MSPLTRSSIDEHDGLVPKGAGAAFCVKLVRAWIVPILAFSALLNPPDAGATAKLYWVGSGPDKIRRANVDGSGVEDLVTTGVMSPMGIAIDPESNAMYWTESGTGKIRSAGLDGSGAQDLVATGLNIPAGIALDLVAGKMYWADGSLSGSKIQRADLDGSNVEDLVTAGLGIAFGLALDLAHGKLYWTEFGGLGMLRRADLDGSNVEALLATNTLSHIALDPAGGKMYWIDGDADLLRRADLDGSNVEGLLTMTGGPGIALDLAAGRIYWAEDGQPGSISRANLDGSGEELVVDAGVNLPWGISLDVRPAVPAVGRWGGAFLGSALLASGAVLHRRRRTGRQSNRGESGH